MEYSTIKLVMDTVTAVIYILKPSAHQNQYSSIFPVAHFLSRGKEIIFS